MSHQLLVIPMATVAACECDSALILGLMETCVCYLEFRGRQVKLVESAFMSSAS